jgi:hypothetical protein
VEGQVNGGCFGSVQRLIEWLEGVLLFMRCGSALQLHVISCCRLCLYASPGSRLRAVGRMCKGMCAAHY